MSIFDKQNEKYHQRTPKKQNSDKGGMKKKSMVELIEVHKCMYACFYPILCTFVDMDVCVCACKYVVGVHFVLYCSEEQVYKYLSSCQLKLLILYLNRDLFIKGGTTSDIFFGEIEIFEDHQSNMFSLSFLSLKYC